LLKLIFFLMRHIGVCILFLLGTMRAMAIDAVVAHTVFYRTGTAARPTPYAVVTWQANPNTLHYASNADKMIVGKVRVNITFSNSAGVVRADEYALQTVPVSKIDEVIFHSIMDERTYDLPPGMTIMKFVLTDLTDTLNRYTIRDSFIVDTVSGAYFFSGIRLLDTVYKSGANNAFTAGGMSRIPISTNFMDDKRKMFYYCAQLYNGGKIDASDYPVVRKVMISKSETEGYTGSFIKTDTVTTPQQSSDVLGRFDIAGLLSGNYYLRMVAENRHHETVATQSLYFQRLNIHPEIAQDTSVKSTPLEDTSIENVKVLNLKKTFIARYTLAQVRGILKMLLPFSDPDGTRTIKGFLKKPDELYMRYYIYNYFAAINKDDPDKAWKEFASKITEVNKKFTAGGSPGYETERGFIYLRYGPPTDVISVENEAGALPYELWLYNTLTLLNHKAIPDAVFLFYRPSQTMTDYRLLHSNVEGEIQNLGWRSMLFTGGQAADNSRAEQFIGNK
jgi:GWxTD domain-containing protein